MPQRELSLLTSRRRVVKMNIGFNRKSNYNILKARCYDPEHSDVTPK